MSDDDASIDDFPGPNELLTSVTEDNIMTKKRQRRTPTQAAEAEQAVFNNGSGKKKKKKRPRSPPKLSSAQRRRAMLPEFGTLDEGRITEFKKEDLKPFFGSSSANTTTDMDTDDDKRMKSSKKKKTTKSEEEESSSSSSMTQKKIPRRAVSTKLYQYTRLKDIHPELVREGGVSCRTFPQKRAVFMPSFKLENVMGGAVKNEGHEAYEQFVVAWMFSEIVPRYCLRPLKEKKDDNFEWRRIRRLRVLELGGGIGAVSTMIQQCMECLDPEKGTHVVFEPNTFLAEGPLKRNKDMHGSRFEIVNGVLSKSPQVPMYKGNIDASHPRAWMWNTLRNEGDAQNHVATGYTLPRVEALLGGPPNILIADCEGGFPPVIKDFPELLDHLCLIYYERDPGDYDALEKLLDTKGFFCVLKANLHRVYVREAKFFSSSDVAEDAIDEEILFPPGEPQPTHSSDDDDDDNKDAKDRFLAETTVKLALAAQDVGKCEAVKADVENFQTTMAEKSTAVAAQVSSVLATADREIAAAKAKVAALETALNTGGPVTSQRRLAAFSRVAYQFDAPDGTKGEWYTGCVTHAPGDDPMPMVPITDTKHHYAVYFDDDDYVFDALRPDLKAVYVEKSFEWTSPWIDDHGPSSSSTANDVPPPPPSSSLLPDDTTSGGDPQQAAAASSSSSEKKK